MGVVAGDGAVTSTLENGRQQASPPTEISWFTRERVQGFTEESITMEGSPQFSMVGAVFGGLGAKALVRQVKTA